MAGTLFTVAEVVTCNIEVLLTHEFVFNEVLNVLDVNESLVASAHLSGDGLGDLGSGCGVELESEESAGDGLLDLGLGPRDDVAIATNEAHGHFLGFFVNGNFAGAFERALEDERLRDIVCVVLDESFFDEKIEVVLAKLQVAAALDLTHERRGNTMCDGRNKGAVLLGEDGVFGLVAGDEEVGKGFADGIGDIGEREAFLLTTPGNDDFRNGRAERGVEGLTPSEGG